MSTLQELLSSSHEAILKSSPYAIWSKANPGEAAKVAEFWVKGGEPPAVKTEFGKALVLAGQALWFKTPDPPPPPPPPSGSTKFFLPDSEAAIIRTKLGQEPYASAWSREKAHADSKLNYSASPPNPNGTYLADADWQVKLYQPGLRDGHAAHSLAFAFVMTGDEKYANSALRILRSWRDVYSHSATPRIGHDTAESMGFSVKMFMALDMLRSWIAPAEYAQFAAWARQWIAVGKGNQDGARDHPWWPDFVINGQVLNGAWAGNNGVCQSLMAVWAAAVTGGATLTSMLEWMHSHVTAGGHTLGWDQLMDAGIIKSPHAGGATWSGSSMHSGTAARGEYGEGHGRRSMGYGHYGWHQSVMIADVALRAGFANWYTHVTPGGVCLSDVAEFYKPFLMTSSPAAIQAFYGYSTGDGANNSDPAQWRNSYEFLVKNLPVDHPRYADALAIATWGGNAQRAANSNAHVLRTTPQIMAAAPHSS